jgi:hypothetical protein
MNSGKTIFAQLMDFLPIHRFRQCVQQYNGNYKIKRFSCWDQFLCMAFAQLTYRESLRDIQACLRSASQRTYHMGIRSKVSRNTLAHANQVRDWRIYADFARILITRARVLYAQDPLDVELDRVYALDSSTIDLCLSLCPWAAFSKTRAAIKLHTLLDLHGSIPSVIHITSAKTHDVNILDQIPPEPGAFYIMDRGYLDFARLYRLHQASAYFVTRAKRKLRFKRVYSQPVDKTTGVQCDQIITLEVFYSHKSYPEKMRRIRYIDVKTGKRFVFLTNNLSLSALTIAELYRCRWKVELFFKWIKQHLRIKAFFGTSENAIKTQIWIAIAVYVLVALVKKLVHLDVSLYTILQILSVTLFEKKPILEAFTGSEQQNTDTTDSNQLLLFN